MTPDSPRIADATTEAWIETELAEARRRLEAEAGLLEKGRHFARPVERAFTSEERPHTTVLFGGLTWKHEKLVQGVLEALGHKAKPIETPDVRAFQLGKEFGNNGQCNPTYFTVGNLVQHLQKLEEKEGLSREEIVDRYVYLTAGACGPCRFGMYESEYRLALRNAGFDGFRVLLFQQTGGLSQGAVNNGLIMSQDFFIGLLYAFLIADLVNEVAYRIRPYEVKKGETDRVLGEVMEDLYATLKSRKPSASAPTKGAARFLPRFARAGSGVGTMLRPLLGSEFVNAMRRARDKFDAIEIDRLRVKPIVKITGEFWAQTTEGDGNFNMFPFLERENAQVLVEPIGTWIAYMIHGAQNKIRDRKGLEDDVVVPSWRNPWKRLRVEAEAEKRIRRLSIARALLSREHERLRRALGGTAHALADQRELERLAHPLYHSRAGGGEGHLEVAKNIYYHNKDLCHMVLSLKPFGCMPSTQSDGVQAAVVSKYSDMIYIPIETSGEGEINAHSRVQMALGEARTKARDEFARALGASGYSVERIRSYVDGHPELRRAMHAVPHAKSYSGEAANFVLYVGSLMKREGIRPEAPASDGAESVVAASGNGAAREGEAA
jgi:predicted nucleotide-binding protein (sugar kinase/HSP70/actin superfamily)